jgi:hypothetical protein
LKYLQTSQHRRLSCPVLPNQYRGGMSGKIKGEVFETAEIVGVEPLNHGTSILVDEGVYRKAVDFPRDVAARSLRGFVFDPRGQHPLAAAAASRAPPCDAQSREGPGSGDGAHSTPTRWTRSKSHRIATPNCKGGRPH